MKGISVWRPWAGYIVLGLKSIETRLHDKFKSLVGQTIFIHAAKAFDPACHEYALDYLGVGTLSQFSDQIVELEEVKGAIIGTVHVDEIRLLTAADSAKALINCRSMQRYGLICSNPVLFDIPIYVPGKQGIWTFPVEDCITMVQRCRVCGCTEDDCSGCIERTGEPCYWVEDDLCSACADQKDGNEEGNYWEGH